MGIFHWRGTAVAIDIRCVLWRIAVAWVVMCGMAWPAQAQDETTAGLSEDQLLAILQSDVPVARKVLVCKRLGRIGTARSVPVIAPLLADKNMAHAARIVLETVPGPEAAAALRDALPHLQGEQLVGVVNSLGARRDAAAVPILAGLLKDASADVAPAIAAALGKTADAAALDALRKALPDSRGTVAAAIADALLMCAESRHPGQDPATALRTYQQVYQANVPEYIRAAALRGMLLTLPSEAAHKQLAAVLRDAAPEPFAMALAVCRELPRDAVTKVLAPIVRDAPPERQALMLAVLADRGTVAARPVVVELLHSAAPAVRRAAIAALAVIGNLQSIEPLLQQVDTSDATTLIAIADALTRLPGSDVESALCRRLAGASGAKQRLLIDVVGRRRSAKATPVLLQLLHDRDHSLRIAAIRALGETVGTAQLAVLTDELRTADGPEMQTAIRDALRVACARLAGDEQAAAIVVEASAQWQPGQRPFGLEVLALLGGATALKAVTQAGLSADDALQDAATRVLGTWRSAAAAEPLLVIAQTGPTEKYRVRALRGYVRIIRQFGLPPGRRMAMIRTALQVAQRDAERRLALEALGRVATRDALALAVSYLDKPPLAQSAAAAVVSIGGQLPAPDRDVVTAALQGAQRVAKNPALKNQIQDLLDVLKLEP